MIDAAAQLERDKYERMWTHDAYRGDHSTAHAAAAIARFQPSRGDSFIDFGAGAGYASRHLQDAGFGVLAIDIAANAMEPSIARRVPLLVGNLWDVPVDVTADWGFCCDVMEHIPPDRIHDVLRFVRKSTLRSTYFSISLRPDGCGQLIGHPLHLTVHQQPWWMVTLSKHWQRLTVVHHEANQTLELVADGWAERDTRSR